MTIVEQILVKLFVFLGTYLEVGLPGHRVSKCVRND